MWHSDIYIPPWNVQDPYEIVPSPWTVPTPIGVVHCDGGGSSEVPWLLICCFVFQWEGQATRVCVFPDQCQHERFCKVWLANVSKIHMYVMFHQTESCFLVQSLECKLYGEEVFWNAQWLAAKTTYLSRQTTSDPRKKDLKLSDFSFLEKYKNPRIGTEFVVGGSHWKKQLSYERSPLHHKTLGIDCAS